MKKKIQKQVKRSLREERLKYGWSQQELADRIGTTTVTISRWENGTSTPSPYFRLKLSQLFQKDAEALGLFPATKDAPESQVQEELHISIDPALTKYKMPRHVDWDDALAVPTFYGRKPELEQLTCWIVQERCHIVSVLGMGGVGKSALAVNVMHHLAAHFEVVIFRSLRDAPPCEALLADCLHVLSPQPLDTAPASLERHISLLLDHLRTFRILLILDNLETLLEEGDSAGRYRSGFEGYGRLLRRVAETEHQSTLVLTSREKLVELRPLEGSRLVRALHLSGLDATSCEQLLQDHEVVGSGEECARLVEVYAGNPLALKIVAKIIIDLFGGEISQFLATGTVIFGNIADLLGEQFARLTAQEQIVLCWLAIVREPISLNDLLALLAVPLPRAQVLEAVDGLHRHSLVEQGQRQGSFTLQSVVLEYVTEALITEAATEIQQGKLSRLIQHGLELVSRKEHIRQNQVRLLVVPLLTSLQRVYPGRTEVEDQLLSLLEQLRERAEHAQGYGPANLIALLRLQRGHLQKVDLSQLSIREAYLQGIEMQDASLAGSLLRDSVFTEALAGIWGVAISPNTGVYWAAGSRQGTVHLWDQGGQSLYRVWQAHTDIVPSLGFSPDSCTLATGSWDGTVKLWDVVSGEMLWELEHTLTICIAWSPDGKLLASCGRDATVKLWDPHTGRGVRTLHHPSAVFAVAFSPDGQLLASGDFDGTVRVWNPKNGLPLQTLKEHTNMVIGLAFSPDGRMLTSGSWDHTLKLWDLEQNAVLQTLRGHTDKVHGVAWSPDGKLLASCSVDQTVRIWEMATGRCRAVCNGHTAAVYDLAFTFDGNRLLSGSEDGTLHVWDVACGQCIRLVQGYATSAIDVAWSPDGSMLVSGGSDGQVTLWDRNGGPPLKVWRGHQWIVGGVGWSPDGKRLASCEWHTVVRLWDAHTGICVRELADPVAAPMGMSLSPDGTRLACGTPRHGILVWDMVSSSWLWKSEEMHKTIVRHAAWSPNGHLVAGGGDDGGIYLWDAATGALRMWQGGHRGIAMKVAFSPNGRQLASCGGRMERGEVLLWDIQSGKVLRTFEENPTIVYAIIWKPSGDLLISGGGDGVLRWWERESGQCVRMQEAHQGTVQALKVSPDGKQLASCGDDGTIMIWDLHSGKHFQTLQRDRPYERLNIAGIRGLTTAQQATLRTLGAI